MATARAQKNSFSHEDLIACARGDLFGPNNAQVTRSAIVRLGAALPRGYDVLAWRSGF